VLVDECGAGGAVAHAFHQFPQAGTGHTGQGVAGMAQIMEVEAGQVGADQEDGPLSTRLPLVPAATSGYPRSVTRGQGSSWRLSLPGQLPLAVIPLIVLKLAGIIGWSWWWVLAPLWSSVVIFVALICGLLLLLIRSQRTQI
jgi:hypothetical protein